MPACGRAAIPGCFWCLRKRDFEWRDFVLPSFIPGCLTINLLLFSAVPQKVQFQEEGTAVAWGHLCFCSSASQLLGGLFKLEQPLWVLLQTLYPAASVSGAQNASVTLPSLTLSLCQGQRWWYCTNIYRVCSCYCIAGVACEGWNESYFCEMLIWFLWGVARVEVYELWCYWTWILIYWGQVLLSVQWWQEAGWRHSSYTWFSSEFVQLWSNI